MAGRVDHLVAETRVLLRVLVVDRYAEGEAVVREAGSGSGSAAPLELYQTAEGFKRTVGVGDHSGHLFIIDLITER